MGRRNSAPGGAVSRACPGVAGDGESEPVGDRGRDDGCCNVAWGDGCKSGATAPAPMDMGAAPRPAAAVGGALVRLGFGIAMAARATSPRSADDRPTVGFATALSTVAWTWPVWRILPIIRGSGACPSRAACPSAAAEAGCGGGLETVAVGDAVEVAVGVTGGSVHNRLPPGMAASTAAVSSPVPWGSKWAISAIKSAAVPPLRADCGLTG